MFPSMESRTSLISKSSNLIPPLTLIWSTSFRSELEVRLEHCQKEMSQMDDRIKFLRAEKSEQFAMVDEIQMELGEILSHESL